MHEATDACGSVHCVFHQEDEPGRGYLICGECGHLFKTKRALRREHRRVFREISHAVPLFSNARQAGHIRFWWMMLFLRADKIWVCPFCAHDF
jgi:rubrerythrin